MRTIEAIKAIKEELLDSEFTPERSTIVDRIDEYLDTWIGDNQKFISAG